MPAFASGTLLYKLDKTFILLFQLKMFEIFLPFQQQQYYPLIAFTLQPWGGNGGKQDSLCLRPQQQSAFTILSAGNRAKQTAWGAHTYFPGCFWIWQPLGGDLSTGLVFGDALTAVGSLPITLWEEIIWAMEVHTLF